MGKKTNNSRDRDDTRKPSGKRDHYIGRNMMKQDKRTRSIQGTRKGRWTIIGRGQNHLCG